jgi:hypothetical protein
MACPDGMDEWLPLYLNGRLDEVQRETVEGHLRLCSVCRRELAFWRQVRQAGQAADALLPAPSPAILTKMLATLDAAPPTPRWQEWLAAFSALLKAQRGLIKRGLWPASAAVLSVGFAVTWLSLDGGSDLRELPLLLLAPIVAALGVALAYGPEVDPLLEVALATPTSPRLVLLARLTLVLGYDLGLTTLASLILSIVAPQIPLGTLIWAWLVPMLFLSGLALLLSLLYGPALGSGVSLALWGSQLLLQAPLRAGEAWARWASLFWSSGGAPVGQRTLLMALATMLFVAAFNLAGREEVHV